VAAAAPARCAGHPDDPLFLGPILINRAYVVGAVVAAGAVRHLRAFFRTRLGIVLRAISDDYTASWSVGISVERGVALSWALSSMVATIAGVLWGSIQGVDQSLALLLLKGVTVAVLGGMDSIGGAILAGLLLGIFEGVASGWLDPLVGGGSRDLVVAATLILTILIRPTACSAVTTLRGSDHAVPTGRHLPHHYASDRALFPIGFDRWAMVVLLALALSPRSPPVRCSSAAACCPGWCGPRRRWG
jgi:hypothetical protein